MEIMTATVVAKDVKYVLALGEDKILGKKFKYGRQHNNLENKIHDFIVTEKLDIWLRECNPRCTVKAPAVNDSYFILGETGALSVDSSGKQHYVLRNLDRFERAAETCTALANVIVLG
ncbi:hypothetical protein Aduo_019818 [Ancylostoma duodenale]